MDSFLSRKFNFTFFLLFIYFSPIVVGPLNFEYNSDSNTNSNTDYLIKKQKECAKNIYEIFKIDLKLLPNKKVYFEYAVKYLRHPNEKEITDYKKDLNTEDQLSMYLLFDGSREGAILNNEYAYKYFGLMSDIYDSSNIPTPIQYCKKYPDHFVDCLHAIYYHNLGEGNMDYNVLQALYGLVILDIRLRKFDKPIDPNLGPPKQPIYAEMYMDEFVKQIIIDDDALLWPGKYCNQVINEDID